VTVNRLENTAAARQTEGVRKPVWESTVGSYKTVEFRNGATRPETGGKRVGYARVSTQGQNLEQQLAALTEAGCHQVHGEKVSSTVPSHKRQALSEALSTLNPGDTLVVAKLDRLGRTQSEVVARLAALGDGGVYVETLDGLLNTKALGRMAPLVVGLLTGLAEVERNLIQERTRESVEHRRRTGGNVGGRPPLPEGRRVLVKRLRSEGRSYREVAEVCGVSLATAHRYAKEVEVAA
jgi:DNA invertase Pin-like site-specific DNA recombinase